MTEEKREEKIKEIIELFVKEPRAGELFELFLKASNRSLNSHIKRIGYWADIEFGPSISRRGSILFHLQKELSELIADPNDLSEVADIFILLCSFINSFSDKNFEEIVKTKFQINKNRKWKKPDKDGVIEHVRD